ncbi:MBL fold metallo-hydrolase [Mesobacillus maritimus]|uniref:MBL fold metallo-hydrolase n=1 Tax=Mesobacillus maritimus TaxID=1643336 RepID=UPI00203E6826|nr:MBL fold metallo-hydrolase [Mesobacillus maritimus]MCM3584981.1 MBL fold metallo-hydrolase [Mesobacillus maritimus]
MGKKSVILAFCFLLVLALLAGFGGGKQKQESSSSAKENEKNNESTSDFKVTLLGTGSPVISMERFSNSTLVEVGGERFLFDAGRGAAQRLNQLDISPGMIDKLFVTHLHHDHVMDFDDILITAAVPDPRGGRENNMQVWGPKGTKDWVKNTLKAYKVDIQVRKTVEGASGLDADVHEFKEGVVYNENGIEIIAFEVDHGPMKPAVGYRINYDGRSVVISGDTTYSENLIKHAKGTDLLIHEVVSVKHPEEEYKSEALKNIEAYHTTPEQAGEVFKQVNPKLAAYTHIALLIPEEEAKLVERAQKTYDGEVVVGVDLMAFEIGEEVKVIEP